MEPHPDLIGEHPALVDHHCHGVFERDLDRSVFETNLNEGTSPGNLGGSFFDSMLGLAVRRWCAPMLDLAEFCTPDDYLTQRRGLGYDEVNRRFLRASGIGTFLVDTGFQPDRITSAEATASYAGGCGREVVRLEYVAEGLLRDGVELREFDGALRSRLRQSGAVGAKSIAAYRGGLDIGSEKPPPAMVRAALEPLTANVTAARISDPVLHTYLAWTAIELELPLQFHAGYGDNDLNLNDADPILLTPFLRASEPYAVPVMLLHNYPFHRKAGYLAQVFAHVFADLGLAVHNVGALSTGPIRELLELAPFGKLVFSSDAFGLAELYYLGALLYRRALNSVADELVRSDAATVADIDRIFQLIGQENATKVYGLDRR